MVCLVHCQNVCYAQQIRSSSHTYRKLRHLYSTTIILRCKQVEDYGFQELHNNIMETLVERTKFNN